MFDSLSFFPGIARATRLVCSLAIVLQAALLVAVGPGPHDSAHATEGRQVGGNAGQGLVVSQGVVAHNADNWHAAGYRGSGVKVGVIDFGFERFPELQASGELPADTKASCYSDIHVGTGDMEVCSTRGPYGTARRWPRR